MGAVTIFELDLFGLFGEEKYIGKTEFAANRLVNLDHDWPIDYDRVTGQPMNVEDRSNQAPAPSIKIETTSKKSI